MSRELKFRGWHTGVNKMFSPEEMGRDQLTIMSDGRGFVNVSGRSVNESKFFTHIIPMQFTGLLDKNKKEIYEGDIVKRHIEFWSDPADLGGKRFVSRDLIYFVEWGKWCYIKREKRDSPCTSFDGIEAKEFEVIGNIYENPELLDL